MGFAGVLSWIFTPSQEQSTAPSLPGVYNYSERTRMEADQGKRQQRAYYEQANDRTNLSLITGASALAIGVGQALPAAWWARIMRGCSGRARAWAVWLGGIKRLSGLGPGQEGQGRAEWAGGAAGRWAADVGTG